MLVSELIALLPNRARKMSTTDAIFYLNYPIKADINGVVQSNWPSYYEKSMTYAVSFPELSITAFADNGTSGLTVSVVNTLSDGNMIRISSSDIYDGMYQIFNVTATTLDVVKTYTVPATGTLKSDALIALPDDCVYPTEIQPESYSRVKIAIRDKFQSLPGNIAINDTVMVVPIGSPYTKIQMWYQREVPFITDSSDVVPYPTKAVRELVPVLLYGMCLEFFRDRKNPNDIQAYLDKYSQAKANMARLSVYSLM